MLEKVQRVVLVAAGGLATLTGGYFIVRHIVKKEKQRQAEKGGLVQGNPSNWAKRLRMAMFENDPFGWTEDEEEIFKIYTEIPTKTMVRKVHMAYKNLYQIPIETHLQRSLNTAEFKRLTNLINVKPN